MDSPETHSSTDDADGMPTGSSEDTSAMETRGPWRRHSREKLCTTPRLAVYRDEITQPDGAKGRYDWVRAPDMVRVAARVDGRLLMIEQYHYLVGTMWQLPGGTIDPGGEDSAAAARRELAEETGYHGGRWTTLGALHPLPGLTPVRVHLLHAEDLTRGDQALEPAEAGLKLRHVSLDEAVRAVRDGRIGCAASAALVLRLAVDRGA